MDTALAEHERASAGWSLCDKLDEAAARRGARVPQILFSSRFPTHPELSRDAARKQKLPLFKEATPVVLNSLLAAVGFVEATLAAQRAGDGAGPTPFTRELQDVAIGFFKESMADYRRWAMLTLVFVAVSLASVVAGAALALQGAVAVATLSSIASLLSTSIATLLYRRLDTAQKALETARQQVLDEIKRSAPKPGR